LHEQDAISVVIFITYTAHGQLKKGLQANDAPRVDLSDSRMHELNRKRYFESNASTGHAFHYTMFRLSARRLCSASPLKRTPFYDIHIDAGAKMVPFTGYSMPVQYKAGLLAEHKHCREKASIFDVAHMGMCRFVTLLLCILRLSMFFEPFEFFSQYKAWKTQKQKKPATEPKKGKKNQISQILKIAFLAFNHPSNEFPCLEFFWFYLSFAFLHFQSSTKNNLIKQK
jgi:hypothetical protein